MKAGSITPALPMFSNLLITEYAPTCPHSPLRPTLASFPLPSLTRPDPFHRPACPRLARACPLPRALCVGAHLVPRPAPRARPASTSNRHAAQKDWEVRVVSTAHALGACVRGAVIHTAALYRSSPLIDDADTRVSRPFAAQRARRARERVSWRACPRSPARRRYVAWTCKDDRRRGVWSFRMRWMREMARARSHPTRAVNALSD
jgi:hypothetical protein